MIQPTIDYLIGKLRTVEGIANVTDCIPVTQNQKALRDYFDQSPQAWEVGNLAGQQNNGTGNNKCFDEVIVIDGWTVYKDSTTKQAMQRIIDQIKWLFIDDRKLGKTVVEVKKFQCVFFQPDWFFETILMHHCRFQFDVVITVAPVT